MGGDPPPQDVFPACGTGEFLSLDEDEYRTVVTVAVDPSPAGLAGLKALRTAGLDLVGASL
ncbi:5-dehydro-4-deoxyglucarate dehydratase [Streptomyces cyanogenus]|uniref:5-dehydro-4-deoxyglucarate dehydratase n=1 Tax=Streptomyces cyanogenus TaxID=80860 RepID=A0ABX7TP11_STRCY|nr:hypothetical protein [Streptomyces cyanogenus]QTD98455.1 5-dehydro-4-deoxyglucarate dehydratase [Streptomyces cyanogenus]